MLSKVATPLRFGLKRVSSGARAIPRGSASLFRAAPLNLSSLMAVRFSSTGPSDNSTPSISSLPNLPGIDDKVDGAIVPSDAVVNAISGVEEAASSIAAATPELGYNPVDLAIYLIENLHQYADIPYWQAIVVFTVGLRILLLPVALKGVQNGNRMAFLKPDMEKVQNAMKASEGAGDPKLQARYQMEMKELFKKHNVNPFRALALPFMQMPIFISLFMGLRQMQDYFPDYCNGGALWFTDLSVADPTYALPIFNALSFLLMVEVGADGMDQTNKGMFKNIMRGLAFIMVPLTASMPQGLFVYWAANNTLSLTQTRLVKTQWAKDLLGIKEIPKAEEDATNPFKKFAEAMTEFNEQRKAEKDGQVQFIGGDSNASPPPPPPPGVQQSSPVKASSKGKVDGPPPVTFASNPRGKSKPKN